MGCPLSLYLLVLRDTSVILVLLWISSFLFFSRSETIDSLSIIGISRILLSCNIKLGWVNLWYLAPMKLSKSTLLIIHINCCPFSLRDWMTRLSWWAAKAWRHRHNRLQLHLRCCSIFIARVRTCCTMSEVRYREAGLIEKFLQTFSGHLHDSSGSSSPIPIYQYFEMKAMRWRYSGKLIMSCFSGIPVKAENKKASFLFSLLAKISCFAICWSFCRNLVY